MTRFIAACVGLAIAGCGGSVAAHPPQSLPPAVSRPDLPLREGETPIGLPGRAQVIAASIERRWVVLRQARHDTNGDGQVCARTDGQHGFEIADPPTEWLVLGSGAGESIDELYGAVDERHLVFSEADVVTILDVESGRRVRLGPRTAHAEWDHLEAGHAATVSASHIVYRRSDHEAVVYDPRTETSRAYAMPEGWLYRAWVAHDWLVAELLEHAPTDAGDIEQLPHIPSSGGRLRCSLADDPQCWGIPGRVVAMSLHDPAHVVSTTRGLTVTSQAVVIGNASGPLTILRHGVRHAIGAPGCDAQLLTLGAHPHHVAYVCDGEATLRLVVFSEDASAPPRDETARLAEGVEALGALGLTTSSAAHLAALHGRITDMQSTVLGVFFGLPGAQAMRLHDEAGPPRVPHVEVDADMHVLEMLPDGRAIARIRRGAAFTACEGDDTQLVWTTVRAHVAH